jgi:cobalt/nickel transport system permease protein
MCSFMVLSMSIPILFLPVHASMAALAGMVLGGWQAVVAVFTANLILAFIQHGGITVVGMNTLVLGMEATLASSVFRKMLRLPAVNSRPALGAAVATLVALIVSTAFMVATLGALSPRGSALSLALEPFLHGHDGGGHALSVPAFGSPTIGAALLRMVVPVVAAGLIVETTVTALLVGFLAKTRPGLFNRS